MAKVTWEEFLSQTARETVQEMVMNLGRLLDDKNHDYSYAVFTKPKLVDGVTAEKALRIRLGDKVDRLINLQNKEVRVADESVSDTIMDMAGYSILYAALRTLERRYNELPETGEPRLADSTDASKPSPEPPSNCESGEGGEVASQEVTGVKVDGRFYRAADHRDVNYGTVWGSAVSMEEAVRNKWTCRLVKILPGEEPGEVLYHVVFDGDDSNDVTVIRHAVAIPEDSDDAEEDCRSTITYKGKSYAIAYECDIDKYVWVSQKSYKDAIKSRRVRVLYRCMGRYVPEDYSYLCSCGHRWKYAVVVPLESDTPRKKKRKNKKKTANKIPEAIASKLQLMRDDIEELQDGLPADAVESYLERLDHRVIALQDLLLYRYPFDSKLNVVACPQTSYVKSAMKDYVTEIELSYPSAAGLEKCTPREIETQMKGLRQMILNWHNNLPEYRVVTNNDEGFSADNERKNTGQRMDAGPG